MNNIIFHKIKVNIFKMFYDYRVKLKINDSQRTKFILTQRVLIPQNIVANVRAHVVHSMYLNVNIKFGLGLCERPIYDSYE